MSAASMLPGPLQRLLRGSLGNVALRGATLALRFAIGFYVIGYLGLEAAGIYGLAVGAVGMVPSVVGWGLNYFLSRDVVGMQPDEAAPHILARLRITAASLLLASAVLAAVWIATGHPLSTAAILILALLWLETIALDVYMAMIGLELAWQANVAVFVRSALWVPVVVALGLLFPALRTIEVVFTGWIVGHLLAILLLAALLREWPIRAALARAIERPSFLQRIRRSWFIYLSDIGLAGLAYVDRFVVTAVLGLAATGVYSFYWSITFALQTLVTTSVVQVGLPRLLRAFREDTGVFAGVLRQEMVKVLLYSVAIALGITVAVEVIVHVVPGRFPQDRVLLATLLLAAATRSLAEMLNTAIASSGNDRPYAITNIIGIVVTIALSWTLLQTVGLLGAAVSALATALLLCLLRWAWLRRIVAQSAAARANDAAPPPMISPPA